MSKRAKEQERDALVAQVARALEAATEYRYALTPVNEQALRDAIPTAYFALAKLAYPSKESAQ